MSTTAGLDQETREAVVPAWRRVFAWASVVAAGFTALCCLGVSAALSLASAVGATFLTEDSSLRPILAATLVLTVVASALTFARHRRPGSLIVTALAAISVYTVIFVIGAGGSSGATAMADQMTNHAAGHGGLGGGRLAIAWTGLVILVAAQLWDVVRVRRPARARRATR